MANELDTESVNTCLSAYPDLGGPYRFAALEGPFHNQLYQVRAPAGEFYLKVLTPHPVYATEERYEYLASVMEHLAPLAVELPLPIRNDRRRLLTACGSFRAELSRAIGGAPFEEGSPGHQEAAGWTLGRFHQATRDLAPRGSSWVGPLGTYLLRDSSLLAVLPESREADALREHFDELLDRCRRAAEDLCALGAAALPRVIVHSEFTAKHLRMTAGKVSGILDFEYTCRETRCLDVAQALRGLSCVGPAVGGYVQERVQAFIHGYQRAGWPLSPAECRAVSLAGEIWDLECIGFWAHYMAQTADTHLDLDMVDHTRTHCGRADWWRGHREECAALLLTLTSREGAGRQATGPPADS